jgi:uncharacterized damage-inducible protein DinB
LSNDYLPKLEHCLDRLSNEQIWWRPNPASNSVGNLVLHLCGNARQWIVCGLGGRIDERNRDSEFAQREVIDRAQLIENLRSTLKVVDEVLKDLETEALLARHPIQGKDVDGVEAVFHVTEHFSMHTGQIILLTKMLTGGDLAFYEFPDGVPTTRWQQP